MLSLQGMLLKITLSRLIGYYMCFVVIVLHILYFFFYNFRIIDFVSFNAVTK